MTPGNASSSAGWHADAVHDIAVRVFEPSTAAAGVVVVLPDSDWPDRQAPEQWAARFGALGLVAVIPEGRSWWIDRPASAFPGRSSSLDFVVRELVPWVIERWPGLQTAAFGSGFGGQGALQLAYRQPQMFPIAAAIRPAIDFHRLYDESPQLTQWFDSQELARQETVTLRLHPLNWPPHQWFACPRGDWRFDGCERLASKLTSIGIPFLVDLETPDGPDYDSTQLDRALRFLADRLNEPPTIRDIRIRR